MMNVNTSGRMVIGAWGVGLTLVCSACQSTMPTPPVARAAPVTHEIHGHRRTDDYGWLKQRDNDEVIAYLTAENAYTEAVTKHNRTLQDRLYAEMKGRIKETDLSVPTKIDDYYYYTRTEEGKQYPIYCRKLGSLDGNEEVLLDANVLAQGGDYFRIGVYRVSPNHKLLAYSVDRNGSETYVLRVKNLDTGEMMTDEIPNTYYAVEWGNDNRTLFYNVLDSAMRPYKIFRHTLGACVLDDQLVHHEKDERFFASISKTRSRKYLLLTLGSQITSEVRFLNADQPQSEFRIIHPRQQGMEYAVEHHGKHFYITTNDNAVNFKVVRAPVSNPAKANWIEFIPHRPAVKIDGVDAFADYLVVYQRENGLRTMHVHGADAKDPETGGENHTIEFPEPVYTAFPTGNAEFNTHTLRFTYTSLVTPRSVFDYDMTQRTRVMLKQDEILGGYDPANYRSERIYATASDGTQIPISLVHHKSVQHSADNPLLLYGYGSYGASMEPRFSSSRVSLLDRGVTYAIAHIRGGGDMGRPWYENGKLMHKRNTFTDFIACAEELISKGYTSPEHLATMGGSAGGLLMGAVVNMRPDLFQAVVAAVPFVDVINTMLDPSIPLTVIEYEEWGNPNEKAAYEYMMSYSPYDNVEAKDYPNMLITAGLNDPRVQYWEPAKWTAKLRATKTDDHTLVLKTNMGAGHGGASGRFDRLKETAFQYAFILDKLGIHR